MRSCSHEESLQPLLSAFSRNEELSSDQRGSEREDSEVLEQNCLRKAVRMNAEERIKKSSFAGGTERVSENTQREGNGGHFILQHGRYGRGTTFPCSKTPGRASVRRPLPDR